MQADQRDKTDPDALLALLRRRREVYRGPDGKWYVTHGGGEWPSRTVLELMTRGALRTLPGSDQPIFALKRKPSGSPARKRSAPRLDAIHVS